MKLHGNRTVLDAFYNPDARLAVWFGGGGTANVYNAAIAALLTELGLHVAPSIMLTGGASSGACVKGYFRGGVTVEYLKVFTEDLAENADFWDVMRAARHDLSPLNIPLMKAVFDGSTGRPMPVAEALAHPARDVVALLDIETAKPVMFERHNALNYTEVRAAACAIPGLAPPITIGNRRYADGDMSRVMLCVDWLMEQEPAPTDVIIFLGHSIMRHWQTELSDWLREHVYYNMLLPRHLRVHVTRTVQQLIKGRHRLFLELMQQTLARQDVRVLIVEPPESKILGHTKAESNELAHRGYNFAWQMFGRRGQL